MSNEKKNVFAERIAKFRESTQLSGWKKVFMIPLALVVGMTSLSNLTVRLGILQNPESSAMEKSALLPYEAPTMQSISAVLLGGIVSEAKATYYCSTC